MRRASKHSSSLTPRPQAKSERVSASASTCMDVQGTRLMIMTYYYSNETGSTDAAEAATLAEIVQSISFP